MPEVAQIYLGNIDQNPALADQVAKAKAHQQLLEVHLQQSDRAKGRISCTSTSGMAIGIIKSRQLKIKTGDVYQTQNNYLLLVELIKDKLLVLSLPKAKNTETSKLIRLGHLFGNQHYPIRIEDQKIYVQLSSNNHHLGDLENNIVKMIKEIGIAGLVISIEQTDQTQETIPQQHLHRH